MGYFTEQSLRRYYGANATKQLVQENVRRAQVDSRDVWVFLSHSHQDLAAIDPTVLNYIKVMFGDTGIKVYIDAFDPTMPQATCAATADKIKSRISSCNKFVLIATTNAISSKWVPWELGYADPTKTLKNVAILPIADSSGSWTGSEYMGLYSQIDDDYSSLANYGINPSPVVKTYDGLTKPLNEWLRDGTLSSSTRMIYG